MRISDWSSDVCSSDLYPLGIERHFFFKAAAKHLNDVAVNLMTDAIWIDNHARILAHHHTGHRNAPCCRVNGKVDEIGRASCRKECVSTCRSRWSPTHSKKQKTKKDH